MQAVKPFPAESNAALKPGSGKQGRVTMRRRLTIIGILYLIALASPAFDNGGFLPSFGIECLLSLPWVLILPAWWANPIFFFGCLSLSRGKPQIARACGLIATGLAISFPFKPKLESHPEPVHLFFGYGFWLASMLALTAASFGTLSAKAKHGGGDDI